MENKQYLGSIEAGGTKFVCAVGNHRFEICEQISFPTEAPQVTIDQAINFFKKYELSALAVGCFGPIETNRDSVDYGMILDTPKTEWQGFNIFKELRKVFNCPIIITTDVNSSAYGEYTFGRAKDKQSCVYFTIGTGIGGGAIQKGKFIGDLTHLEMGHAFVHRHPKDDKFAGVCPYHGSACFEGVASGPSLGKRLGMPSENATSDHEIWNLEAYYLAQLAYNARLNLAPEIIIFGGGVMAQTHLLKKIQTEFEKINNGYVVVPPLEEYIVRTNFKNNSSATIGNFALALNELGKE